MSDSYIANDESEFAGGECPYWQGDGNCPLMGDHVDCGGNKSGCTHFMSFRQRQTDNFSAGYDPSAPIGGSGYSGYGAGYGGGGVGTGGAFAWFIIALIILLLLGLWFLMVVMS